MCGLYVFTFVKPPAALTAAAVAEAYMACEQDTEKNCWAGFNEIWQECFMVHASQLLDDLDLISRSLRVINLVSRHIYLANVVQRKLLSRFQSNLAGTLEVLCFPPD
jgi:hypothetical protein